MRWLVGVVSAIAVLGMSPGPHAETSQHRGTVNSIFPAATHAGVGDPDWAQRSGVTPLYTGEVSGQLQEGIGPPCANHWHYTWAAAKLLVEDSDGRHPFELRDGAEATAFDESGSGSHSSDPCGEDPGCSTGEKRSNPDLYQGYVYFDREGSSLRATAQTFEFVETDSACGRPTAGPGGVGIGSGTFPISAIGSRTITVKLSKNVSFDLGSGSFHMWRGSGTLTLHRVENRLRAQELVPDVVPVLHRRTLRVEWTPPSASARSYQWQMKRSRQFQWTTLGTTTHPSFRHTFRLAGHFRLRAIAHGARARPGAPPRTVVTRAEPLEVRFPTWREIVADKAVQSFTTGTWRLTKDLASRVGRQELGYWIALDTCQRSYLHTALIEGPVVGPDADGAVVLGQRPADIPTNPPAVEGCATYTVASFHTHPPTKFRNPPGGVRVVGPSPADDNADKDDMVPGVVIDYKADPAGGTTIPNGHEKEKPAKRYQSGLPRRPTPRR